MATLTVNPTNTQGATEPVTDTMSVSDTIAYNTSQRVLIHLDNVTGGSITVTFDGSDNVAFVCPGTATSIDTTVGYPITIPAGEKRFIMISTIREFIKGTIEIVGSASGVESTMYLL